MSGMSRVKKCLARKKWIELWIKKSVSACLECAMVKNRQHGKMCLSQRYPDIFDQGYPISDIRYPISDIQYPISNIQYPIFDIRYRISLTKDIRFSTAGMGCGKKRLECVAVKKVGFRMAGMWGGPRCPLYEWLECFVVKDVSVSMAGMCCDKKRQCPHVWNVSW
jgi:hypothetical protein